MGADGGATGGVDGARPTRRWPTTVVVWGAAQDGEEMEEREGKKGKKKKKNM